MFCLSLTSEVLTPAGGPLDTPRLWSLQVTVDVARHVFVFARRVADDSAHVMAHLSGVTVGHRAASLTSGVLTWAGVPWTHLACGHPR